MNFLKTSLYTSVSTAITFICGFIVAKVVAVKIGPPGIAMVGQFQNTMSILVMLGSGAVNMGVVKYLSEKSEKEEQQKIITTALSVLLCCSAVISLVVILSSRWLSTMAFHSPDYWLVYTFFGAFLFFITSNTVFTSIFNGLKQIRRLTTSNIFFSIAGIIFTVLFAYLWGVKGVLVAVNATALAVFAFNYYLFSKGLGVSFQVSLRRWDAAIVKKLFAFSAMSVLSAFLTPMIQLLVRDRIISGFSITEAGYWQGVTKISDYYLTFITTVLSVYYLPRLSEIKEKSELRAEVFKGYKIILPTAGFLALGIWVFRHYVIQILFSSDFLPMKPLFTFQLIGDFIKIASWLLGYLMWARAMVKTFLITEVVFSTTFVLWSYFFINQFGVMGATYAFAVNYTVYLITVVLLMRKHLF